MAKQSLLPRRITIDSLDCDINEFDVTLFVKSANIDRKASRTTLHSAQNRRQIQRTKSHRVII